MPNSKLLIAVVDDEEQVRKALRRLLRSAGMEVDTFPSGEDFVDSLRTRLPDCVVVDLHMPGMTGARLLQHITQGRRHMPVIIVTGMDEENVRGRMLAAGAANYLLKPIDEAILLAAIRTAVRDRGIYLGAIAPDQRTGLRAQ